jgi:hypothetical protein
MVKISDDNHDVKDNAHKYFDYAEAHARGFVDDLSLIAEGARQSRISAEEAERLETGEKTLKRGFAAIAGLISSLDSRAGAAAYAALNDLLLGAYVIGSRGVVEEIKVMEGYHARFSREGGDANGKRKQKEALETWQNDALSIAKSYVGIKRSYSQEELAEHIKSKLGRKAPRTSRIINVIAGWQKNGDLPKSIKSEPVCPTI